MLNPQENEIRKIVKDEMVKESKKKDSFTTRKLGDTPTDDLQLTPRKYVNLNGTVANRPKSSIASVGMSYYATDTFIPMTYSAQGWRNGSGSIVALNN